MAFLPHTSAGAEIGENCSMGQNVNVSNNVKIGNGCKLQNDVSVYEGVEMRRLCFLRTVHGIYQ